MSEDYETRTTQQILGSLESTMDNEISPLLDRITVALETLAESTIRPVVLNQYNQSGTPSGSLESHPGEVPAEHLEGEEYLYLADGRKVPKRCVDALDEYENTWPGASFPNARTGLAWTVIAAYDESFKKADIAEQLCLDDDPNIREKASPCVRYKDHDGNHQDNASGFWPQRRR
jgi:hypothetical protein